MLPENFPIENIDRGIRSLVTTLNRIPDVHTMTTCEGHIWGTSEEVINEGNKWKVLEIPFKMTSTKDGWIHFYKPKEKYANLVERIKGFSRKRPFLDITEPSDLLGENIELYTINGRYEINAKEQTVCYVSYTSCSPKENHIYFQRAKKRKIQILRGWAALSQEVYNYIRENINPNPEELPFI